MKGYSSKLILLLLLEKSFEEESALSKPPTSNAAYPMTLFPAPAFPNLSNEEDRRRLSPAALRGFLRIMHHWGVRDEDARVLLNDVSNGTFYQWKLATPALLDQDRLMRISYLVGIFKSLNILFNTALADRWVRLPNSNAIFAGRTPLAYMLAGGTPAMHVVRQLLDARRGG